MNLQTIFGSLVAAIVIGLVWCFALNADLKTGITYSAISGVIFGFLLGLIQNAVVARGNVKKGEGMFVSGSLLAMLTLLGVILGVIVWIIRAIFF